MVEDGFNTHEDLELKSRASESAAGSIKNSGFNIYRLWARVHVDNYGAQKNKGEYLEKLKGYLARDYPSYITDLPNAKISYKLKKGIEVHMIFKFKGLESKFNYVPLDGVDIPKKVLDELKEADEESGEAQLKKLQEKNNPKKKRSNINYSTAEDYIPISVASNVPEISLQTRLDVKNAVEETRRRLMEGS
ncbi:MAG: hypothetical protein WCK29_04315 [archaeon]